MKKVCVVVGSRANYSSIKSAMIAIKEHEKLELQVVIGASAVLDRYGDVSKLIAKDGFSFDAKVFMILEGETPLTMAKTTGMGIIELSTTFDRLQPDFVVTVGDRYETMATTIAAAYMNITLVHTMGGEVTGTIDESIRHAITKFAHLHFPACEDAKERIIRLGELPKTVFNVGCPRIDLVKEIIEKPDKDIIKENIFEDGVGGKLDINKPFLMLSQHPITTEFGEGEKQILTSLEAIKEVGIPCIVLWPNSDAGSKDIARGMRKFRERHDDSKIHFFKNLPTSTYIKLMNKTACLIGNSSSAIREGAFIGTPAINIGTRQNMRQRGDNIIDVDYDKNQIKEAIKHQVQHGKYKSEDIYGNGNAGKQIADILANVTDINIQKVITY